MKFQSTWLELPDHQFDQQILSWFTAMKSITYKSSTRKEHVQTAVDTVFGIKELRMGHMGGPFPKWEALGRYHLQVFREPAPRPSRTMQDKLAKRKVLTAKKSLLTEKVALLTYWETHMYASDS